MQLVLTFVYFVLYKTNESQIFDVVFEARRDVAVEVT